MQTISLASAILAAYTVSDRRRFLSDPAYFRKLMQEQIEYDDNSELLERAVANGAGKVILQYLDRRIWPVDGETAEFLEMLQTHAGFSSDEAGKIIKYLDYLAGWEREKPTEMAVSIQNTPSEQMADQMQPEQSSVYAPELSMINAKPEPVYEPLVYTSTEPEHEPQLPPTYTQAEPTYESQASLNLVLPEPVHETQASPATRVPPATEVPVSYETPEPYETEISKSVHEEAISTDVPIRSNITITEKDLIEGTLISTNTIEDGIGFSAEYFYPFLVRRMEEHGVPVNVSIGRLKSGGLLSSKYEDIIVVTHSERPKYYPMAIVYASFAGKTAFVKLYFVGEDKSLTKAQNVQQNSWLYNKITGAAVKAQRELDASYEYGYIIGNCYSLAFEDATY